MNPVFFEALLVLFAFFLAVVAPRFGGVWFGEIQRLALAVSLRRRLAPMAIGLLTLLSSAALSTWIVHPLPRLGDEFSYLLAADTFAHGRWTNPPHDLAIHFESLHIIQNPTYASKYPPAQGLMLAAGKLVTGRPLAGVWLSVGLATAALCWMFQAWLPLPWALFGSLLVGFRLSCNYWGQSYWGGAVAAMGGALLFGGLRRILEKPHRSDAFLLGAGIAVLANSRPYEGLLAVLAAMGFAGFLVVRRQTPPIRLLLAKGVLPVFLVLLITFSGMAVYNQRVTGNPFLMPYEAHDRIYSPAPMFLWQRQARPIPTYSHQVLHDFWVNWILKAYLDQRALKPFLVSSVQKIMFFGLFFLGVVFTVPLLNVRAFLADRWMRFALLACLFVVGGMLMVPAMLPHYAAPLTGLIYVLVFDGVRRMRSWQWRGRDSGVAFIRLVPLICAATAFVTLQQQMQGRVGSWAYRRAEIAANLQEEPGLHLVVVRYSPNHIVDQEWVYNDADIDKSKVVWAREMDEAHNRVLLDYFINRKVWLLRADESHREITPYPAPELNFPASPTAIKHPR